MNARIDRARLATELLALSKAMLAAAEENRWDFLDESQGRREQLASALFAELVPGRMGDMGWVAIVEEVQGINDELIRLASRQRDEAARELRAFRNARKCESVYAEVMGAGSPGP